MPEVVMKPKPVPFERAEEHVKTGMKPIASIPASNQVVVSQEKPAEQPASQPQDQDRFAALEKRERSLRAQARQLQALKKQLDDQAKVQQAPAQILQQPTFSKEQFLKDPLSQGITYEEVAQLILNQPSAENQALKAVTQQIESLKKAQEDQTKQAQEAQKIARANAVKQISREVNTLVNADESFESIKTLGRQDAVTALIELTYDEEGYVMTTEDACKEVEDYLTEQAIKMASLKKVKDKLNPTEQKSSPKQQNTPTTTTTLSRASTEPSSKPLSAKAKRDRAIAAFIGQLK